MSSKIPLYVLPPACSFSGHRLDQRFCKKFSLRTKHQQGTARRGKPISCPLSGERVRLSHATRTQAGPASAHTSALTLQASFASYGLFPELVAALNAIGIETPTAIQIRAIPALLGGASAIIGSATGSGKTLAYLLPIVQRLKIEEHLAMQQLETEQAAEMIRRGEHPLRKPGAPRALILTPTRELAEQVLDVSKQLAHYVKIRAASGLGPRRRVRSQLEDQPIDVLVTTSGRLLQLLDEQLIRMRDVRTIVLDEVDTLLTDSDGFGKDIRLILRKSRNAEQFIAVGATHPAAAQKLYTDFFPKAKLLSVDLHQTPSSLRQQFIRVSGPNGRTDEILALLKQEIHKKTRSLSGGRVMVFCNTVDSCRFLDHFLQEHGFTTANYHGDIPKERRIIEYEAFARGERQILVCTDIAARGLDYNHKIDHVILFDFPRNAVDYLHRAGRTARGPSGTGTVTSLVTKKDMPLAKLLEEAVRTEGTDVVQFCEMKMQELAKERMKRASLKPSSMRRAEEPPRQRTRFDVAPKQYKRKPRY
jgi:superfamily II DNA/RNA helicase